jgi:hypothetical protein
MSVHPLYFCAPSDVCIAPCAGAPRYTVGASHPSRLTCPRPVAKHESPPWRLIRTCCMYPHSINNHRASPIVGCGVGFETRACHRGKQNFRRRRYLCSIIIGDTPPLLNKCIRSCSPKFDEHAPFIGPPADCCRGG